MVCNNKYLIEDQISYALDFKGMPPEQSSRTVLISQKMNKTLQSGDKFVNQYTITWYP
jgi:hypothetical protein